MWSMHALGNPELARVLSGWNTTAHRYHLVDIVAVDFGHRPPIEDSGRVGLVGCERFAGSNLLFNQGASGAYREAALAEAGSGFIDDLVVDVPECAPPFSSTRSKAVAVLFICATPR